jgi:hypothetical protein
MPNQAAVFAVLCLDLCKLRSRLLGWRLEVMLIVFSLNTPFVMNQKNPCHESLALPRLAMPSPALPCHAKP